VRAARAAGLTRRMVAGAVGVSIGDFEVEKAGLGSLARG
jgi:hypothetical protein